MGDPKEITIKQEETEFRFAKDHELWAVTSAQGKYSKKPLSKVKSSIERPCIVETGGGKVVAIAEAAMVDHARMRLRRYESHQRTRNRKRRASIDKGCRDCRLDLSEAMREHEEPFLAPPERAHPKRSQQAGSAAGSGCSLAEEETREHSLS